MEPTGRAENPSSKFGNDWELVSEGSTSKLEADQLLKILKSLDSLPGDQVTYDEKKGIFISIPTGLFAPISKGYWGDQGAEYRKGLDLLRANVDKFYKILDRLPPEEFALISPQIHEIQSLFKKNLLRFKDQEGPLNLLTEKIQKVSKGINILTEILMHTEKFKGILKMPLSILPLDVCKIIFSDMSYKELDSCSLVSKEWKKLVEKCSLTKYVVYENYCFKPSDWNLFLGEGAISKNEIEQAWSALPKDIGEILNSPCPIWGGKK